MSFPYIENLFSNLNDEEQQSLLIACMSGAEKENKSAEYLKGVFKKGQEPLLSKVAGDAMRSRIYDKSIDALIHERHISNSKLHSEHDYNVFKLKKRLLHFRVLLRSLNQGRVNSLKIILNGIIADAKHHEVYDVLVEALMLKKHFIGIRSGISEFERIDKEIEKFSNVYRSLLFANDCYYRLILNNNLLKSYSKEEYRNYLTVMIRKLKRDYASTHSAQVNYYLHLILVMYNERAKKYGLAIKYCNKLVDLINKNKVVYRKERVGFALDNLSKYKTFAGKFQDAARHSREAQTYYIENSYNYIASKGQEFHVYFYHKKYDKALRCSEELIEHSLSNAGKFRRSKFIFFQACVKFAIGDFRTALSLLNNSMEIEKDKSGWNITLRILLIMIYIELDKMDEAGNMLEKLRKSVERASKSEEVTDRDVLILKALRELEKDSFRYSRKNTKVNSLLDKLSEKNKPYSWEYYTPELIPFHQWLSQKVK